MEKGGQMKNAGGVHAQDYQKPSMLADNVALQNIAFHSLLAEVLGPGDDEAAFLSLLAEVLGPGDDEAVFVGSLFAIEQCSAAEN